MPSLRKLSDKRTAGKLHLNELVKHTPRDTKRKDVKLIKQREGLENRIKNRLSKVMEDQSNNNPFHMLIDLFK